MTDYRKPEDIAVDLNATRERLVQGLDELVARSQPEAVAKAQFEKVKDFFHDADGNLRQDRVARTAGVFFGLLVLRKLFK